MFRVRKAVFNKKAHETKPLLFENESWMETSFSNESAKKSYDGYKIYHSLKECLKTGDDENFKKGINNLFKRNFSASHRKFIEIYVKNYESLWTMIVKDKKSRAPDDESRAQEDESRSQEDESRAPDDEGRAQEDESIAPDDESRAPDDGSRAPDDGSRAPDDESRAPDDGSRAPDVESRAPDDGSRASYDKFQEACKSVQFYFDLSEEDIIRNCRYMDSSKDCFIHNLLVCLNDEHTLDLLNYLDRNLNVFEDKQMNPKSETWLHAVVKNVKCNKKIIEFVMYNFKISPKCQDNNGETALHQFYYNFFHNKYDKWDKKSLENMISLLCGKDKCALVQRNKHGITPVHLVCYDKRLYDDMIKFLMGEHLFKGVSMLVKGFADIEMVNVPHKYCDISLDQFWEDALSKNSRSYLIACMKDAESFEKGYYNLGKDKFESIYSNQFAFSNVRDSEMHVIYEKYRKNNIELSELLKFPGAEDFHFYRSAPFLALISGRWDLVMPLIAFSRFDVVPYCLLTCAACVKMQQLKNGNENISRKAKEMHQNADAYLAEVVKVIEQKHARRANYNIVQDYLTKCRSVLNRPLMDIAYFSNCKQFFKTSSCQAALTHVWKEKRNCLSPFAKFVTHFFMHILFLVFLFSVLLTTGHKWIFVVKIFCYFYGLGYFVEEVRQMVFYYRVKHWKKYFRDATNVIDLFGLLSFLVAFVLQCGLWYSKEGQIKQSFSMNAYTRLFLCLTAIFLSVRLLYFLSVFKIFAPKLKMIERMIVVDLFPVSMMFLVFITSFGMAFQSLIFSGFSNKTISIEENSSLIGKEIFIHLIDILWQPTLTTFKEKYVIEMAEKSESPSIKDSMINLVVQFLLIMFIIIVSVMLMNMLIALFGDTVRNVRLKESWTIGRWKLIQEYTEKSSAPPPLNISEISCLLMKQYWKRYKCTCSKDIETDKATNKEEDRKTDIETDYAINRNPFEILCLLEDRFELLENCEESDLAANIPKMMYLQRKNIEKMEKDQLEIISKKNESRHVTFSCVSFV